MRHERAWIPLADGARLAARLWLPDALPAAVLLEALPYRMDDLTASYASEYERLCSEYGFAVARVDLRGTGSSDGLAVDEYPPQEQADLGEAIAWLAAQEWSTGRVGMWGTSYSGFNSLQLAAERPPALGAVAAIYATDDRYTDDVHYTGGALRGLDLLDYVLYMAAITALPPVPAVYGDGWRDAVARARRAGRAVAPALARGADGRPVLAPRIASAGLRADRLPDHADRRLGGRLPQQHLPDVRGAPLPEATARRAVEPHVARDLRARAEHRPRAGARALVRPLAPRRGDRRRRGAADPGLRPALDAASARPRRAARRVALRGRLAARARRDARAAAGGRRHRGAPSRGRRRHVGLDLVRGPPALGPAVGRARGRRALARLRVGAVRGRGRDHGPPAPGAPRRERGAGRLPLGEARRRLP